MDQIGILQRSILFIKARRGKSHDRLIEFIKEQRSLKKVIEIACLSTEKNGKRHRHQNRINKNNLLEFNSSSPVASILVLNSVPVM